MSDMTPSDRELVDEYASRLLDADVSRHEIPAHLVEAVDARLAEFARLRTFLRFDRVDPSDEDSRFTERTSVAVSAALASMSIPSTPSPTPSPTSTSTSASTSNVVRLRRRHVVSVLAAAAAVAVLVAIGLSDRASAPDDMVADAPAATEPASDLAQKSAPEATVSMSDGDTPSATEAPSAMAATEAIAPTATADAATNSSSGGASAPGVELPNVEALRSFLFSEVVANGRLLDGVLTRAAPLCPDPDGRVAIDRVVMVDGRPAELHWSAADGAVVYLLEDCSDFMYLVP